MRSTLLLHFTLCNGWYHDAQDRSMEWNHNHKLMQTATTNPLLDPFNAWMRSSGIGPACFLLAARAWRCCEYADVALVQSWWQRFCRTRGRRGTWRLRGWIWYGAVSSRGQWIPCHSSRSWRLSLHLLLLLSCSMLWKIYYSYNNIDIIGYW